MEEKSRSGPLDTAGPMGPKGDVDDDEVKALRKELEEQQRIADKAQRGIRRAVRKALYRNNFIGKFRTHLGLAMKVIKHQSDNADQVIMATAHQKIDRETAEFLNRAVNLKLEYEEESGGVDMCLAMENKEKKDKITEAIEIYREYGESEEFIVDKIIKKFNVSKEYVLAILKAQVA